MSGLPTILSISAPSRGRDLGTWFALAIRQFQIIMVVD
jgi:hypothetical protein